ncbi:transient receptor potential cation channel subfamily A member 1-like [Saccoglossus kowalevskii]
METGDEHTNGQHSNDIHLITYSSGGMMFRDHAQYVQSFFTDHSDDSMSANLLGVFEVAAAGNLQELQKIHKLNPERISLQDSKGAQALHYAAGNNKINIIEFILEHGGVLLLFGDKRDTYGDLPKATDMVEFKPKLCAKDCNGVYPIHAAATHASANVLKLLLDEVEKLGYTRDAVLNFVDKERNSPMHSAVNGGDTKAVKLCLESGARLDVQQSDKSTPVHLACSQGAIEMIKVMFSLQDKTRQTLRVTDIEHMTPIHKAAMFDHPKVVEYLISEGSEIDPFDKHLRTPLLLATSKGGWRTVKVLLENGADFKLKDKMKRNILHLAIINGGSLAHFDEQLFQDSDAVALLNEKDLCGCTPMHYASRTGNIKSLQGLLELGALVNAKDDKKQSPMHFAARYGRYHTIRRLLDSRMGPHIINDTDGKGMTALHLASYNGHAKVVQLLMARGALLHRDHKGNTPLHLAAMSGYTDTMKVLLGTHAHLIDQVEDDGNTALHLAAREANANAVSYLLSEDAHLLVNKRGWSSLDFAIQMKNKDVALAFVMHDRWKEAMLMISTELGAPMLGLIEHLPEVCIAVLDRCLETADVDIKSCYYWIKYDFRFLQAPIGVKQKDGTTIQPLIALNLMVIFRFDIFGIYVVMFLEILKTLVQVLLTFSIVIIAFGLSFYILMSQEENQANSTPWFSIYRMVIMMLGEIDYIASFVTPATDGEPKPCIIKVFTFVMLFVFVLLMPILLMNLLIGLAVGDIAGVQRNAQLKRLAMQVELHTELEQKLPMVIIKRFDRDTMSVSPNCPKVYHLQAIRATAGMDTEDNMERNSVDPVYQGVQVELVKQKRKMKEISNQLDKQYEMLRLIVQKMDIRNEDDEQDEGDVAYNCDLIPTTFHCRSGMSGVVQRAMGMSAAKKKLQKQVLVIRKQHKNHTSEM